MKRSKYLSALLALALCGALSACAGAPDGSASPAASASDAPTELTVFAAASMTETLTEIAALYQKEAPNVTLIYNFDSSGTLKTQIEEGAVCDLFLSAGRRQMDELDAAADPAVNTESLDFVSSRCDLLKNKVVLIVPADAQDGIASFADAGTDRVSRIALGGADVPVGQYAEEIFQSLGLWDALNASGKITFGTNVKEVVSQVEAAAVDCGVVYKTDAAAASGVRVVAEAPADTYSEAIYPAAVLKTSAHPAQAQAFLDFLQTDACRAVFEKAGFDVL